MPIARYPSLLGLIAALSSLACSTSVGTVDGATDGALEVGICTGICLVDGVCRNGATQTGQGHCQSGTFVCETRPCASDAGAAPD